MNINQNKKITTRSKTQRRAVVRKVQPAKAKTAKWDLRLYVTGGSPKAVTAFKNLKLICEDQLKGKYQIKVVDILKRPHIAHDDQIVAVPTLIRKFPLPVKNIIGDLSNTERVLFGLDLLDESVIQRM